jgi:indole-3-glycerol phosphate synthase
MFLDQIVAQKREEVRGKQGKRYLSDLKSKIADARATRDFREALERDLVKSDGSDRSDRSDRRSAPALPRLIAEIKKASPSKGLLRERFDPIQIANSYQESGASAISVLTDERFFQGSLAQLGEVQEKVRLPILQKDFILDPIQIYEARAFGADAVLLIAALLEPAQIKDYADLAEELSMDAVVEVHDEREMERVLEPAKIIGINNRDLETF